MKPNKRNAIEILLANHASQHEINRKTGIDRKTIRKYAAQLSDENFLSKSPTDNEVATGSVDNSNENPPPWPPEGNQPIRDDRETIRKYAAQLSNEDFLSKSPTDNEV
ncbi:MAG: hypothetical protein GY754_38710, partial [bacterium]|nr:hypothetical protein [bacterium]